MSDLFSLESMDDGHRLQQAWTTVITAFGATQQPGHYERFLNPLKVLSWHDGRIEVAAPGQFVYDWVRERYLDQLEALMSDELDEPVQLILCTQARTRSEAAATMSAPPPAVIDSPRRLERGMFRPNPKFRFDNYVVGQSNRLAVAGAKAVAANPGAKYNPLVIYGPSGLGKTHILHAIANEILSNTPDVSIMYVSAQQFAEDFVIAIQTNRMDQFRREQRKAMVWLVDDIQFVGGKEKTQEEIFHTFNNLHQLRRQIVITSDKAPKDLLLMEDRLKSRLEYGLVADVQMPDTETRCAILLRKAQDEELVLPYEVAVYLAANVPGNIRVLEGSLTKLAMNASLTAAEMSVDMAAEMVERYYRAALTRPSVKQIVALVGDYFNVSPDLIFSKSRKAPVVHARHISIYLVREITGDSWTHVASEFGDRDHSSMMHAYKKIMAAMKEDSELRGTVEILRRRAYPEG